MLGLQLQKGWGDEEEGGVDLIPAELLLPRSLLCVAATHVMGSSAQNCSRSVFTVPGWKVSWIDLQRHEAKIGSDSLFFSAFHLAFQGLQILGEGLDTLIYLLGKLRQQHKKAKTASPFQR